jgi:hypothetical protein
MNRPDPLHWLGYALGLGLPVENRDWILHDTTCPTWVVRHISRSLLQMAPIVLAILLFVPGPFWIRGMSALGGLIMGMIYSIGYIVETTEHRLVKAGYPVGTGQLTRDGRTTELRTDATARRRAKMLARMDRRAGR